MQKSPNRLAALLGVILISAAPAMGAIITVDSITQFGVNGADMAGSLLVTAMFDDGSSETASWISTGAFSGQTSGSTGWSLGVTDITGSGCLFTDCGDTQPIGLADTRDAALIRGLWTLETNEDGPAITSLELTGLGADDSTMTIFDRFFRTDPPFNGPDDFGTLGSDLGFTYSDTDPLLPTAPPPGTFGQYLDPIQLSGSGGPLNDVFATFVLNFNEDPFEPSSSMTFLLDTDLSTPPAVPEPSTLLLFASGFLGLTAYRRRSRR